VGREAEGLAEDSEGVCKKVISSWVSPCTWRAYSVFPHTTNAIHSSTGNPLLVGGPEGVRNVAAREDRQVMSTEGDIGWRRERGRGERKRPGV
jgi:hypothetical protein